MMSKLYFSLLLVVFFTVVGYSQSNISVGVNIGPNYTSYRGSDSLLDKTNSGLCFLGGIFIEYKISKHLAVTTGINLDSKTIIYKNTYSSVYIDDQTYQLVNVNGELKTTNKYEYFTVPLFLKYSFGKQNSLFVKGGGFLSVLQKYIKKTKAVNSQGQVFENYSSSSSDDNFALADDISGDHGVLFGFGKSFKINENNIISVELRDNLGLANVVGGTMDKGISGSIKTNSLSLIAIWTLEL